MSEAANNLMGLGEGAQTRTPETPLWPEGHRFALFLSHDVDQIHDREMWRLLGDVNHIRRVLLRREPGNVRLAARRIGRALVRPKNAASDYSTILELEARHGFRSTFFVLHDRYWARHGARFRITDPELHDIVQMIKNAGCEVGVHGGYYHLDDAAAYEESRQALSETFDVEIAGIRNHLLRFSGTETWRAQASAGYRYDATFGTRDAAGPRDECCGPFWAVAPGSEGGAGLVELPLTVMDTTLFRYCRLEGEAALDAAWSAIRPVIDSGGLVTLLWHANFFDEPEYWDWQWVYGELLGRLASLGPWCATGAEVASWWRQLETGAHHPLPPGR